MKILLLTLLLMSCSPEFSRKFWHDETNPCTYGQPYYNKEECKRWQEMEPKQYEKYLTRIKKYERAGN
jgi:hypothetical protein